MWHSHLNDMEIPETKRFIPKGFELGTILIGLSITLKVKKVPRGEDLSAEVPRRSGAGGKGDGTEVGWMGKGFAIVRHL